LKTLHQVNPVRVKFMRNLFGSSSIIPFHGYRILDVGCGAGILSEVIKRISIHIRLISLLLV
jgi:2-polyprenyl-3-methyl-5-hydroxy-6-metoxy-1,4-benzoquinol methylase